MNDTPTPSELPLYLKATEPLELEDIPLQVALLTMELAAQRQALLALSAALRATALAAQLSPDLLSDEMATCPKPSS
jgi:hypothetical protein